MKTKYERYVTFCCGNGNPKTVILEHGIGWNCFCKKCNTASVLIPLSTYKMIIKVLRQEKKIKKLIEMAMC